VAYVTVKHREGIAVVQMDRPPANALDRELGAQLIACAEELRSTHARAVVLSGSGKFFSAGLDLKIVPTLGPDGQSEMVMGVNRLVAAWSAIERPVVCAVTGHAIAGGLVLALCGDYRVGAAEGKLGLTEVGAGVPFPAGAMAVVCSELAPAAARLLTLGAGLVEPARALELGMLDEIAAPEDVVARALAVANQLGDLPAETFTVVKRQLRGELIAELQRIVAEQDDPLLEGWLSTDTEQAAARQLQHRS
jgi:enoyl-CoA hydratase/carnithine racemase